ncbi:MAG TPA: phosphoribosylformylglycinamidine cyclo-ligase [Candidatus Limnocylindrales bacterium]|nr:phosphoribosylformylglycinamidine cyclo-ligase [Candidatus Limnocylindrales bacterium]
MSGPRRTAYAAAGVDVAAGETAVELIRSAVESTRRAEVIDGLGGFAAAFRLPSGLRDPVVVASTDGVGTKTAIARAIGRFDTLGIDLVAMCADDVLCLGAEPIALLDYVAVGRVDPPQVAELVSGVAEGCRLAGCALVGGETAEHPGVMEPDEFDLSGCCIGVADRDDLLDGAAVRAGDLVVGLPASGLHANGFSLVRSLVAEWDVPFDRPYQEQLRRSLGDGATDLVLAAEPARTLATVGDVLLTPTRIYARDVLALRAVVRAAGEDLHGIAHVTGGGLPGNVPRALPPGLGARLDPGRWTMPSELRLIGALGGLDDAELRATFNGGLGLVIVLPPGAASAATSFLAGRGIAAAVVGEVVDADRLGAERYAEGRLESVP